MAGYYPDWSAWTLPPESVDFNRFDVVDFAFAIPTWDGRLEFTQDDSSDLLQRLSKLAHKAGKRVKLSIGGWTGSKYFSTLVADPALRKTFVNNCVQAYWAYGLDGIDIDWEYPNAAGAGGNAISPDDSANFLLYLAELRQALPSVAIITLATQVWPFAGIDQKPLEDVSAFAAIIDWIIIMNYDIWGCE
jgi:chitinase